MEATNWQWIAIIAQFAIIIAGFITGRSLSGKRKRRNFQKFMVGSFIPIILTFLFPPFVYDRSFAESSWKADYSEVISIRDAEKRIADQSAQIERLNEETTRLRRDLREANDYYSRFASYSVLVVLVFCFVFVSRKAENEGDSVERNPGADKDD